MIGRIAVRKSLLRPVVLWTDESKFELFGSHRRQYVRRKVNERFKPDCIVPTVKHGGRSVMVWDCFSHAGVGQLKKIEGIMKKEQYHSILQRRASKNFIIALLCFTAQNNFACQTLVF